VADHSFRCRSCSSADVHEVIDLGDVPPSDAFPPVDDPGPDPRVQLRLFFCDSCLLVQLGPVGETAPEQPLAVDSRTAIQHAEESAARVVSEESLAPGQRVLEHDSGHGASWLPAFSRCGLVQAEPEEQADLVADIHNLMHHETLDPVLSSHAARLEPGGVLFCEFFHARPMVVGRLVDTIRHGHFVYLTLLAAEPLFARHGLTITRAREVSSYGGSLQVTARRTSEGPQVTESVQRVREAELAAGLGSRAGLEDFAAAGRAVSDRFRDHLVALAARGRRVAAYGAPSKAAVLLALAGVDRSLLPYTVDLSPAKDGRRIPGAGVPIHRVEHLLADRPDDVVVLTWDIADEVAAQLHRMAAGSGWDPTLFAPLPQPREIRFADVDPRA
jgi:hypothetical protein